MRQPLEAVDASEFGALTAGDVVFFDGSHRVFQNSDVTVFFLEILPALPPGVLVQIHDIFWPVDYPPAWADRYYSEQYMAGCCCSSAANIRGRPAECVHRHTHRLVDLFDALWNAPQMHGVEPHGLSLWLRTR